METTVTDYIVVAGLVIFLVYLSVNYQKIKVKKMLEEDEKKSK
jgi:hypothetical protein